MPDRLLTGKEVAARLHVSLPTVYKLADNGTIPCVRVGNRRRFLPQVVEDFITSGGATGTAA